MRQNIRDKTASFLQIDDYAVWPSHQKIRSMTKTSGYIDDYSFCESLIENHDLVLADNTRWIAPSHYRTIVRSLYFLSGKENKLINYCYTARRPRNPTPLKELISQHLDGEMSVLFVIPEDSEYMELLRQIPHQFERNGIIFASNRHELKQD